MDLEYPRQSAVDIPYEHYSDPSALPHESSSSLGSFDRLPVSSFYSQPQSAYSSTASLHSNYSNHSIHSNHSNHSVHLNGAKSVHASPSPYNAELEGTDTVTMIDSEADADMDMAEMSLLFPADYHPNPGPHPHHSHTLPTSPTSQFSSHATKQKANTFPYPLQSRSPPVLLQVKTAQPTPQELEHDEYTARPGAANAHRKFHGALQAEAAPSADVRMATEEPESDQLLSDDEPANSKSKDKTDETKLGNPYPSTSPSGGAELGTTRSSSPSSVSPTFLQGLTRPLLPHEELRLAHLDRLKFFLATAPGRWDISAQNEAGIPVNGTSSINDDENVNMVDAARHPSTSHPALNRFLLPSIHTPTSSPQGDAFAFNTNGGGANNFLVGPGSNGILNGGYGSPAAAAPEYVSCVLWSGLYHITGTDIVRALVFRFEAFGRPVRNMKKFEEGVFSDLRNLKPGVDACLEEPKSPFLDLLFKYQCIRTQKKQKVFYWFSVPHDRLFLDALERDLKREKIGQEPTTIITGEPALSFTYDSSRTLYEQFSRSVNANDGEGELEAAVRTVDRASVSPNSRSDDASTSAFASSSDKKKTAASIAAQSPFFAMFSLFEGSPTYKQRRKKSGKNSTLGLAGNAIKKNSVSSADGSGNGWGVERGRGRLLSRQRYNSHASTNTSASGDDLGDLDMDFEGISAADMFIKQARGELVPSSRHEREKEKKRIVSRHLGQHEMVGRESVHYSDGYDGLQLRARSVDDGSSSGYLTDGGNSDSVKTKAYVCPLFSCGRMFKQMENLTRHLRTHTIDRPFGCPRCNKRFTRNETLSQHLQTHARADEEGITLEDNDSEIDELENDDEGTGAVIGTGLGMFGGARGMGMGMGMTMGANAVGYSRSRMPDPVMCEIEVSGQVREVLGDEEGLLVSDANPAFPQTQEIFYTLPSHMISTPPSFTSSEYTDASGSQWAVRPQSSPSYSNISASSPPTHSVPLIRSGRNSLNSSPASYIRQQQSRSASNSVYGGDDYSSLSAPSHKRSFDHAALYPPGMIDGGNVSDGPGPIRRHRSMTPSLARDVSNIRRPVSSASGDFPRGYHPYNGFVSSKSASGSAHSSPASHNASLAPLSHYDHQTQGRGTPTIGLQEQMNHLMSSSMADRSSSREAEFYSGGVHRSNSNDSYSSSDVMYRTESPVPYQESPSQFTTELPQQFASHGDYSHSNGLPSQFDDKLYAMPSTLIDDGTNMNSYSIGLDDGYYRTYP